MILPPLVFPDSDITGIRTSSHVFHNRVPLVSFRCSSQSISFKVYAPWTHDLHSNSKYQKLLFQFSMFLIKLWNQHNATISVLSILELSTWMDQGTLKGKVSMYHWLPVWLVWNQLFDNWQILFLFAKIDRSKPVKQEVNSTMILPSLVFPGWTIHSNVKNQCESGANVIKQISW